MTGKGLWQCIRAKPGSWRGASPKRALTREFRETVRLRAERDPAFRKALFREAPNAYLTGEEAAGRVVLKDLINATIGFEDLVRLVHKPSRSLYHTLSPKGNPTAANFFRIVRALQGKLGVGLIVKGA